MPEGPELARSRDHLRQRLTTRRILEIQVLGGRYAGGLPEGLTSLRHEILHDRDVGVINGIDVKGKFMYWTLGQGWYVWCTYGMSGQWSQTQTKHSSIAIFHGTTQLGVLEDCIPGIYFNDERHFGTIKFVKGREVLAKKLASLGPDMLNDPPDETLFAERLLKKERTLAEALMDQSCVSGVGNYIKAEALYLAELSPHRLTTDLSAQEFCRLRDQVINVMKAAYANNGATFRSYYNVDGAKGGAQSRFVVYGNRTDPMGNQVIKEETRDGRTTHWVPAIQR